MKKSKIEEARYLISKARLVEAITKISEIDDKRGGADLNEVISINRRYSSLLREKRLGIISLREATLESNKIVDSMLQLLTKWENENEGSPSFKPETQKKEKNMRYNIKEVDGREDLSLFTMTARMIWENDEVVEGVLDEAENFSRMAGEYHSYDAGVNAPASWKQTRDLSWSRLLASYREVDQVLQTLNPEDEARRRIKELAGKISQKKVVEQRHIDKLNNWLMVIDHPPMELTPGKSAVLAIVNKARKL